MEKNPASTGDADSLPGRWLVSTVFVLVFAALGLAALRYNDPQPVSGSAGFPLVEMGAPMFEEPRRININAASLAELDLLPGIGPAMAERILDYRHEHGPFESVEELDDIQGIGPKTIERLRPLITIGPAPHRPAD